MRTGLLVLSVVLTLGPMHARCVLLTNVAQAVKGADVVFVGTVVTMKTLDANRSISTFRVTRAWKGDVDATVRIYGSRVFEGYVADFQPGREYLVFGKWETSESRQTEDGRVWWGFPGVRGKVLRSGSCGGTGRFMPTVSTLKRLGPGWLPSKRR